VHRKRALGSARYSRKDRARGTAAGVLSVLTIFCCLAAGWPDAARPELLVPSAGPRSTSLGVYRPGTTEFFASTSRPGFGDDPYGGFHFAFGDPGDVPVVGDWDGNGSQTQGVYRDGVWSLANTLGRGGRWPLAKPIGNLYGASAVRFGEPGDRPLVGDWDGDGRQTIGVQRGNLFLLSNSNVEPAATSAFNYGEVGDVAVVGDWDGDGVDTIGVYRSGVWQLRNANSGGAADVQVAYGGSVGVPVVGDWDADGRVGIGLFDRGGWHLSNSVTSPATDAYIPYGQVNDQPLVGNWGPTSPMFSDSPAPLSKFFPLAVDFQPPSMFGIWKSRGVNTVIRVPAGTDPEQWTSAANALGLKMIRAPRADPELDNAEPNLLAFAGPDEPDLNGCDPGCVGEQYRRLKAIAPTKPYLLNVAGSSVLSQFPTGDPQACSDASCIMRYVRATDWVSHDVYPANAGLPLATIGDILDRLRRWSDRRPQFAYIEAADYDGDGRGPTPDQFRGEIWEAIIHGARGISYFVVDANRPAERPDALPPGIVSEMRTQNAKITRLTDVLQSTINPSSMSVKAKPPIEYTWRRVGSTTYLIAVNQSAVPVGGATMKVFGVKVPSAITVWGEGRTLASSGNGLTDSFGAYEVHVYRF
jgi:hypothetical protein